MQLLKNVRLTNTQIQVLSLASVAAESPGVTIPNTTNHQSALKFLMKLGVVANKSGQLSVTDTGVQLGKAQGVLDDSGHLTPAGEQSIADLAPPGPQGAGGDISSGMSPDGMGDPSMDDMGGFDFEEPESSQGEEEMPPKEQENEERSSVAFLKRFISQR